MQAAIYARKSTEQAGVADEQKSVRRQIDNAKAFAATKGWQVRDEHIYVDDGISGAEFKKRPGFMALMSAATGGEPLASFLRGDSQRTEVTRSRVERNELLHQATGAGRRRDFRVSARPLTHAEELARESHVVDHRCGR